MFRDEWFLVAKFTNIMDLSTLCQTSKLTRKAALAAVEELDSVEDFFVMLPKVFRTVHETEMFRTEDWQHVLSKVEKKLSNYTESCNSNIFLVMLPRVLHLAKFLSKLPLEALHAINYGFCENLTENTLSLDQILNCTDMSVAFLANVFEDALKSKHLIRADSDLIQASYTVALLRVLESSNCIVEHFGLWDHATHIPYLCNLLEYCSVICKSMTQENHDNGRSLLKGWTSSGFSYFLNKQQRQLLLETVNIIIENGNEQEQEQKPSNDTNGFFIETPCNITGSESYGHFVFTLNSNSNNNQNVNFNNGRDDNQSDKEQDSFEEWEEFERKPLLYCPNSIRTLPEMKQCSTFKGFMAYASSKVSFMGSMPVYSMLMESNVSFRAEMAEILFHVSKHVSNKLLDALSHCHSLRSIFGRTQPFTLELMEKRPDLEYHLEFSTLAMTQFYTQLNVSEARAHSLALSESQLSNLSPKSILPNLLRHLIIGIRSLCTQSAVLPILREVEKITVRTTGKIELEDAQLEHITFEPLTKLKALELQGIFPKQQTTAILDKVSRLPITQLSFLEDPRTRTSIPLLGMHNFFDKRIGAGHGPLERVVVTESSRVSPFLEAYATACKKYASPAARHVFISQVSYDFLSVISQLKESLFFDSLEFSGNPIDFTMLLGLLLNLGPNIRSFKVSRIDGNLSQLFLLAEVLRECPNIEYLDLTFDPKYFNAGYISNLLYNLYKHEHAITLKSLSLRIRGKSEKDQFYGGDLKDPFVIEIKEKYLSSVGEQETVQDACCLDEIKELLATGQWYEAFLRYNSFNTTFLDEKERERIMNPQSCMFFNF